MSRGVLSEPLTQGAPFVNLRSCCQKRMTQLEQALDRGDLQIKPEFAAKVLRHLSGVLLALEACVVVPAQMPSSGSPT